MRPSGSIWQEAALELGRHFEQERKEREKAEISLLHIQRQLAYTEHCAAGRTASVARDALRLVNGSLHGEIAHIRESVAGLRALLKPTGSGETKAERAEEMSGTQNARSMFLEEAFVCSGAIGKEEKDEEASVLIAHQHKDDTFTFTLHSFWQMADDKIPPERMYIMRRWIALTNSILSSYMPFIRMWRTRKAALMWNRAQPSLIATSRTTQESPIPPVSECASANFREAKKLSDASKRAVGLAPLEDEAICHVASQSTTDSDRTAMAVAGADVDWVKQRQLCHKRAAVCASFLRICSECVAISGVAAELVQDFESEWHDGASELLDHKAQADFEASLPHCALQDAIGRRKSPLRDGRRDDLGCQKPDKEGARGHRCVPPDAEGPDLRRFGDWQGADVFSENLCARLRHAHARLVLSSRNRRRLRQVAGGHGEGLQDVFNSQTRSAHLTFPRAWACIRAL